MIIVGCNDQGDGLNHLHHPRHFFVDKNKSLFASDSHKHRVMKWMKNVTQVIVTADGQCQWKQFNTIVKFK